MNKILYRYNHDKDLLLIFFINSGKKLLFFDGFDFTYTNWETIENADLFQELKFSKKTRNKELLEIQEIKHDDCKVFYIKLSGGAILEIKRTIRGYGEIAQVLFIVKPKGLFGRHDEYVLSVIKGFSSAKEIKITD